MTRRPRPKSLSEMERDRFVLACERFHGDIVDGLVTVAPSSPDYKALSALSDSVIATIRAMGREPTWMKPASSNGFEKKWGS